MRMISASAIHFWALPLLVSGFICLLGVPVMAGPYLSSAHGNGSYGVNRFEIDAEYADYATGNCAHCHNKHAGLDAPVTPSHTLFMPVFDDSIAMGPYEEKDNFCFSCHGDGAESPLVRNKDYSEVFGGASVGSGPQSILQAFNLNSQHNLKDIWSFLNGSLIYRDWFANVGNPCSACHNSHLAKRNWDNGEEGFPLLSTISKPGISSTRLWGETELMSDYSSYEEPYEDIFGESREPAGSSGLDGNKTSDFIGFCASCHKPNPAPGETIWSSRLNRDVAKIDWDGNDPNSLSPDKHGTTSRDGTEQLREPYASATISKGNFVLSCLDCHESHGSENVRMLRRRINGEDLEGVVASTDAMSYVCKRCHMDDLAVTLDLGATAGTGDADRWRYIHHDVSDAPYVAQNCTDCHGAGQAPIACGSCHRHGFDDSWLPVGLATGRKTF